MNTTARRAAVLSLLAAGLIAGAASPAAAATTNPVKKTSSTDLAMESRAVTLTNQARVANGCAAVRVSGRLTTAARAHSIDMAKYGYFSHTGRDGSTFVTRAQKAGYANPVGENIAWGYRTADETVTGWLNSPGHRANILNCAATTVGVGVARRGDGTPYWTQVFGA